MSGEVIAAAVTEPTGPTAPPSTLDAPADSSPEPTSEPPPEGSPAGSGFAVRVPGFEGPFDLLLALIAKHRIEVTELALHVVTDDFVAHVQAQGADWDLDEATSFLVIAATLLDLKAARLLPDGQVEDEEDLALLEARDLLFARLLQYRAFKEVAGRIDGMLRDAARRRPRDVSLEPWQADLLPEVLLGLTPAQFAAIAEGAFAPKPPPPEVSVAHVHAPAVSVREQAAILAERLRHRGELAFTALTEDAATTLVVVGRFLALLELYREGLVRFTQDEALGVLLVRWTGAEDDSALQVDEYDGAAPEPRGQWAQNPPAQTPPAQAPPEPDDRSRAEGTGTPDEETAT